MRILIFHGYLLRGTGSNIYNASLVRTLVEMRHEVHLLCQDRDAGSLPFVDAVARFDRGRLEVERIREPVRCTAYLPDIGRTLPVYVADRYEGFDAVPFTELDEEGLERYLAANVAAVRTVAAHARPDVALANHLVMGPAILARGLAGAVPYAVKVHGSALEYAVRRDRRLLPYAREGLAAASGVLVGSRHTAESLFAVVADPAVPPKTRLGPPGVDTHSFRPLAAEAAHASLRQLADRVERRTAAWGGDPGAPDVLRALDPREDMIVTYLGKLIVSKGVDLLLAAWPLVARAVPAARLCVVGFGTYRDALRRLVDALATGNMADASEVARRGRQLEGGPAGELRHLAGFLERLPPGYREAARGAFARVHFTGRLEHEQLPPVLAASLAQVVPSTFPEAFGMVAAEAAACGALPLSAAHSGLAEVTRALEAALPSRLRPLLSFDLDRRPVEALAEKLVAWLTLDAGARDSARQALSDRAHELFGWERVAEGVIAAAQGRLDALPGVSS